MEDLSIQTPQIIHQVSGAPPPPPPSPRNFTSAPVNRQRAYNQGLMQLEILLEMKETLLGKGTLPTGESVEDKEQWEKEIADIRKKIQEIKKTSEVK